MVDDYLILAVERLRDDLAELKTSLRNHYADAGRQVTNEGIKKEAARLAETWIVEISQRPEITQNVASDYRADLSVHFQRLLTFSEHSSKRSRYHAEINLILKDFTADLVIPLKRLRHGPAPVVVWRATAEVPFQSTAFVGQSFADSDRDVNECARRSLEALGVRVVTGEKPKADRISEKVKTRIDAQYIFVALFTRRDRIHGKKEWTTSPWVIDEKAYASSKGKKLIIFKEAGVGSIGGIQGDYEYIEFSRDSLETIPLSLVEIFDIEIRGLRD